MMSNRNEDSRHPHNILWYLEQAKGPWKSACLFMASAIILGAFGAHSLKGLSPKALGWWDTATRYLLANGVGLLVFSLLPNQKIRIAQRLLSIGIIIFSGSLYIMALTNLRWLGAITPIGGVCMIIAWCIAAFAISKDKSEREE